MVIYAIYSYIPYNYGYIWLYIPTYYITIWVQGAHIPTRKASKNSMVTGCRAASAQATSACGAMMRNPAAMTLTPCRAPLARRIGWDMGRNSRMDRNPMCGCDGKRWIILNDVEDVQHLGYLEMFLFWKVHVCLKMDNGHED